jgi:NAD(P) transhydrogenase
MSAVASFDILVVGSGPAGQTAAIQGAKAGKRVAVLEREPGVGGACVYRGTIPSKTLRETALQLERLKRSAAVFECRLRQDAAVSVLMHRLDEVVKAHAAYMADQLARNGVFHFHGRARFLSDRLVEMLSVDGGKQRFTAETIVIATGSRPRVPPDIPIDHENILDSDSILSMIYLPRSLTVLGGGVVASEYASIFSLLGVEVTMIDRAERPVQFLDQEIVGKFVQSFERQGGRYCGRQTATHVRWDGVSQVVTTLADGRTIASDKLLVALGRQPNLEDLNLRAAGLSLTQKGTLDVNEYCQTGVPHIYAVGDVIGPPGLASCAMEQGRRAIGHALGLSLGSMPETIPLGVYTIPEMASVGLDEAAATKQHGAVMVGRARFDEVARGQISGIGDGLLKLVADSAGERLLGVQIVGEGATELIHLGQMALQNGAKIDAFVESIFNFPTLAEAYRVAALDLIGQRRKRAVQALRG